MSNLVETLITVGQDSLATQVALITGQRLKTKTGLKKAKKTVYRTKPLGGKMFLDRPPLGGKMVLDRPANGGPGRSYPPAFIPGSKRLEKAWGEFWDKYGKVVQKNSNPGKQWAAAVVIFKRWANKHGYKSALPVTMRATSSVLADIASQLEDANLINEAWAIWNTVAQAEITNLEEENYQGGNYA